jgi:DNA-binding MarR family transcriptional regulator
MSDPQFDLTEFLPYLLNQAAEAASGAFQNHYRERYGMLRTEWRVLFHLGCYGDLSAKDICRRARIHKTKVSRAVHALEAKRFLKRDPSEADRRVERLTLTPQGRRVFKDLSAAAADYDARLTDAFDARDVQMLRRMLLALIDTAE